MGGNEEGKGRGSLAALLKAKGILVLGGVAKRRRQISITA